MCSKFGNFTVIWLLSHPLSLIKLRIGAKICLDLRLWMGPFFIGHCSRTQILAQKCFFVLHMAEMVFFNRDHGNGLKMEIFTFPFSILYTQKTFLSETEFQSLNLCLVHFIIHQEVLIGGQYSLRNITLSNLETKLGILYSFRLRKVSGNL